MTLQYRAFDFVPASIDEKARTVELIASTGADVPRFDMEGQYLERLLVSTSSIDFSRSDGMPLLDSHRQDGLDRVLGVVTGHRLAEGKLFVTVRVSERQPGIWSDIKAGIIRTVSIGYEPLDFADGVDPETGQRVRKITKWRLLEVSLVPVGADDGAKTRSFEMTTTQQNPAPAPAGTVAAQPSPSGQRATVNAEIRALVTTFGLEATVANDLIDREASIDQARAAILEGMKVQRTPPAPRITMGFSSEDPATFREQASEALYCRHTGKAPSEQARQHMNLTTVDVARECLRLRSISTTGLAPANIVERALHTTSDFPNLLTGTGDRALKAAYEAAPAVLKTLARKTTAVDFRTKHKLQIGEAPKLEAVNESGEYKYGTMSEGKESYKLGTFGKIIGLSRQAIVNDDLGAFVSLNTAFGQSSAEFEAQYLIDLLESGSGNGPVMGDGYNLFDATNHGNKAGSGAAPGESTLSAARLAMRNQTGLSGRPINVAPRFILVPAELETTTEKLLATIQPTKSEDVNPFGGKFSLLVEARLSSTVRWYMVSDPAVLEGLEYAYLQGQEGPYTETRVGFEVDGIETKCRLDFGAGFVEYRSWYQNAGA